MDDADVVSRAIASNWEQWAPLIGPEREQFEGRLTILLRKLDAAYDATNRSTAAAYIQERMKVGEHLTGLLYIEESQRDFHDINGTPDAPLNSLPFESLSPGSKALEKVLARYR